MTTLKPEVSQEIMVTVQSTQVNADISLTPKLGGRSLREREGGGDLEVASSTHAHTCTYMYNYYYCMKVSMYCSVKQVIDLDLLMSNFTRSIPGKLLDVIYKSKQLQSGWKLSSGCELET